MPQHCLKCLEHCDHFCDTVCFLSFAFRCHCCALLCLLTWHCFCLLTVLARKFNIGFLSFRVEQRSPTIYVGGGQDFLSEIGLFRRLPGTDLFASRVKSGSTIELGENVQLRSIVRGGDGKMSNFNYNLVRRWRHFIFKWICTAQSPRQGSEMHFWIIEWPCYF